MAADDILRRTVIAGFFTGGALAVRGGMRAARNSAIGCACLLAVIEGVGIGVQRLMAENTKLEVSSSILSAFIPCPFLQPLLLSIFTSYTRLYPVSRSASKGGSNVKVLLDATTSTTSRIERRKVKIPNVSINLHKIDIFSPFPGTNNFSAFRS